MDSEWLHGVSMSKVARSAQSESTSIADNLAALSVYRWFEHLQPAEVDLFSQTSPTLVLANVCISYLLAQ